MRTGLCLATSLASLTCFYDSFVAATTYTWTGSATSANWSQSSGGTTNWQGNIIPLSDPVTQLVFSSPGTNPNPNQNIANPFNLNAITFGGSAFTLTGNAIQLSSNGTQLPQIVQNSTSAQVINNNLSLANDLTLSGTGAGQLTLGGTIDGAHALTANLTGPLVLGSAVGASTPLLYLSIGGITSVNGGSITTSSFQNYDSAVTLGSNATFASSASAITFFETIDGAFSLSVNTPALSAGNPPNTSFEGAIGATAPLASITTSAAGTTSILGGSVTTTGAQTYNSIVTIPQGRTTTFTSTASGNITFAKTFDPAKGSGAGLNISTAGTTTFGGMVGGINPLSGVDITGGGPIAINGGGISTLPLNGVQFYGGPVMLGADAIFTGSGQATFKSTVNGPGALTITGPEELNFDADIGVITPLSSINVSGSATISLQSNVKTTGSQAYDGPVNTSSNLTLTSTGGGDIDIVSGLNAKNLVVNTSGVTTLASNNSETSVVTDAPGSTVLSGEISTTGSQTYNDSVTITGAGINFLTSPGGANITFANTLDGGAALSLNTSGTITFGGVVGGIASLTSLTAGSSTNAGSIVINGGAVTTTGVQTFGRPVTIGANTTFTSTNNNSIIFNSTIDGAFAVTISSGAQIVLGAVGATTALSSLSLSSGSISGSKVTAGSITQTAGTNKTTFTGLLHATGAAGISLTGNNFSLAAITIDQGPLLIIDNGSATVSGAISGAGSLTKSGSGSLTLQASSSYTGSTTVSAGAITLNAGASLASTNISVSANSNFNINGTLASNTNLTTSGTVKLGPGSSGILTRALAALNITGGNLAVAPASNHTLRTLLISPLTLSGSLDAWQGQLDLSNNDMVIPNGDLPTLTNQLHQGFNNGKWTGSGIVSSSAISTKNTALGLELNDDGTGTHTPLMTTFDNQTVTNTDVLVKYTFVGDADLSGTVTSTDYTLIDNGFNSHITGWRNGDFNYDGQINGDDYTLIDNAFNTQGSTTFAATSVGPAEMIATDTDQIAAAFTTAIPEPAALTLLAMGAIGLLMPRQRNRPLSRCKYVNRSHKCVASM